MMSLEKQLLNTNRCRVMWQPTPYSLRDGIISWELQEQKCQLVRQHRDVVQAGQADWMVLILRWKMVKFLGWSALAVVLQVAVVCSKTQLTRCLGLFYRSILKWNKVDGLHAPLILQLINHLNERSIVNGNNNEKLGLNADNEIKMMITSTNKQKKLR